MCSHIVLSYDHLYGALERIFDIEEFLDGFLNCRLATSEALPLQYFLEVHNMFTGYSKRVFGIQAMYTSLFRLTPAYNAVVR